MLSFFCCIESRSQDIKKKPIVAVVPIKGSIDEGMVNYLECALEEAVEKNADIVVIVLDTYGGLLYSCDEMRELILRSEVPIWTFIDFKAGSAGAMIAISSEKIYMTKDALIGACTVVSDHKPLYDKYQSFARARMRSSAQLNGRDTKIAENMVGYYDPVSKQERVLSLTAYESVNNGYCEGIYGDVLELIEKEVGPDIDILWPISIYPLDQTDDSGFSFSGVLGWVKGVSSFLFPIALLLIYGSYRTEKGKNLVLTSIVTKVNEMFIKKE